MLLIISKEETPNILCSGVGNSHDRGSGCDSCYGSTSGNLTTWPVKEQHRSAWEVESSHYCACLMVRTLHSPIEIWNIMKVGSNQSNKEMILNP